MGGKIVFKWKMGLLAGMVALGGAQAAPPGANEDVPGGRAAREGVKVPVEERSRRPDLHPSNGFRYDSREVDDRHYRQDDSNDRPNRKPRHHRHPPRDFHDVRIQIHDHRHYFGRGPDVRTRVIIVRGQPLPPGWGRPMTREQLRYLPYYHGYEWRRIGADMILVEIATGIVHEVLVDVLLDD